MLPYYLAIGVSYETFMLSNPVELKPYAKAFKIKRKIQDEQDWTLGQYVMSAFSTVMANAFTKGSNASYVKEPILSHYVDGSTDTDPEINEKLAVAEMMKFASVMRAEGMQETNY